MGVNLRIQAIIETAIYADDLQATAAFYQSILGLPVIGKEPGRHVFFQVGEAGVLLAFLAEATLKGDQAFWDMVIEQDGKAEVRRSAERYLRAIGR